MAFRLGPAGNTYNPCLLILRDKGYSLRLESTDGEEGQLWIAQKGDAEFLAGNGPELLGLVVLWEHYGEDWCRQQPNLLGELLEVD